MSEPKYTPPMMRNILLGIVVAFIVILAFGYLADIVKWAGATLLFIPARLGIIQQVSQAEIVPVDFSSTPTRVTFPVAGQYAFYTADYSLLVITDNLISTGGQPWLNITSTSGERIPVAFIDRGLMPYDTPLVRGRPIFAVTIDKPGTYTVAHPSRPLLTVHFVRDYVSGQEDVHVLLLSLEVLAVVLVFGFIYYRRRAKKERVFQAARREKRRQVDAFWKERQNKKDQPGEAKQSDRWNDL